MALMWNKCFDTWQQSTRERVRIDVVTGFDTLTQIVDRAVSYIVDDDKAKVSKERAREFVTECVRTTAMAQLREQAGWPDRTDVDRLESAFAQLDAAGIITRHNFTCCSSCTVYEMGLEIEAVRKQGRTVRGCASYHMQDAERAIDDGELLVRFDSYEDVPKKAHAKAMAGIAGEVVSALKRQKLKVEWDGSPNCCIHVKLKWRKRLRPEIVAAIHQR